MTRKRLEADITRLEKHSGEILSEEAKARLRAVFESQQVKLAAHAEQIFKIKPGTLFGRSPDAIEGTLFSRREQAEISEGVDAALRERADYWREEYRREWASDRPCKICALPMNRHKGTDVMRQHEARRPRGPWCEWPRAGVPRELQ